MKTEAAIFDIGNVLLLFDYMKAARRLMEKSGMDCEPDRARITAANREYELGHTTPDQFLSVVRPEFRDSGDEAEFVAIWEDIFEENTRMTSLARRLAEKMPVFLISNIGPIHHKYIFRQFEVFQIFRDGVYSYRAGFMKPSPEIFEIAIRQFGIHPEHTLYFDDLKENCEAAAAAGLRAHHYEPHREDLPGSWNIPL